MELRLLTTEAERRIFAHRMEQARAQRGAHFRETRRSNVGRAHLSFGQLYALFEHDDEPAECMMSGFIMHDLATFPQSYPKPDLSRYSARSVLECGELWSYAKGAGILARRGAAILAGLGQIRAILVYPIVDPWDNTVSYAQSSFAKTGDPVAWPFCELLDGGKVWVQPMVLDGDNLARLIHNVFALGFQTLDSHRRIRFDNPFAVEPSLSKPHLPLEATVPSPGPGGGHDDPGHQVNGSAQA